MGKKRQKNDKNAIGGGVRRGGSKRALDPTSANNAKRFCEVDCEDGNFTVIETERSEGSDERK